MFPMATSALCNSSCSFLTLKMMGLLLYYLLTSASSAEGGDVNQRMKTFFLPFFFQLAQLPDPAHSSNP